MSYVYSWWSNDDDLFYVGYSSGDYKNPKRARRMVGVTWTNKKLSRAESYFLEQNKKGISTTIKILAYDLSDNDALLLESALILIYKKVLLNSAHLKLNKFYIDCDYNLDDVFSVVQDCIIKIKNKKIYHNEKIIIFQKPRMLYIEYFDRFDIITPNTFKFQYGVDIKTFLKLYNPRYYKIVEIGFEWCDDVIYYDKIRF